VTGRTIVLLPNWLGDMVMAIPFLYSLRRSVSGELWFCGKQKAIHLYNGLNLFDRFLPLEGKEIWELLEVSFFLRKKDFELGIVLPHSFRSALTLFMGAVKERIGYEKNLRGILLSQRLKVETRVEPTVEHYLRIADFLGIKRMANAPFLAVTEDEERCFSDAYGEIVPPYCVFTVGAKYGPSKCWPEEYYAELADIIADEMGIQIYILPDGDEREKAERIKDMARKRDLIEIKYLNLRDLKVCISKASFLVSNDTGPRHIGSSLCVPTFVIAGPMDETYTRYPSSVTTVINSHVPCSPCNKKDCKRGQECMRKIEPKMVFEKIREFIGHGRSRPGCGSI